MKPRVAIVDDEADCREVLRQAIELSGRYECAGSYGSGEEALQELPKRGADFVLMDIALPGISGLECMRQLKRLYPSMRVIVVSGTVREDRADEMARAGANGYLGKPFQLSECIETMDKLVSDGVAFGVKAIRALVESFQRRRSAIAEKYKLTERELEILDRVASGRAHKEIAAAMGLSLSTVNNHLQSVFGKLGVHNAHEALAKLQGG